MSIGHLSSIHGTEPVKQTEAQKPKNDLRVVDSPPVQAAEKAEQAAETPQDSSGGNLQELIDRAQSVISQISRDLQFSVDEDSGKTVVKVLDSVSGDLIRQIPSEEMLKISQALSEAIGELPKNILFDEEA